MRVWKWVVTGLVPLLFAAVSHATPEDDYQKGLLAYQRGDVGAAMGALRAPAKAGHAPSQYLLGFLLDRIDMVDDTARLWREASAQGNAEAHAGLASLYQTGRGVAKDEKAALFHFSEAAARGHEASINDVATAWLEGKLGADAAANPATALAAIQRAAGQGHLPSADALAAAYRGGRYGLPVDEAQAQAWQARAAAWRKERAAPAPAKGASR